MEDQPPKVKRIKLIKILRLDEIQPREKIDRSTVDEYAQAMSRREKFPPVVVFLDPEDEVYRLADGFHRMDAAYKAHKQTIEAEIREGNEEDAIDYANGANARNGRRLTNADKRRVVDRMLGDERWRKKSDKAIARHAGVTDRFVAKRRKALTTNSSPSTREVVRNGKKIEMNVSNIGSKGRGKKAKKNGSEGGDTAQAPPADDQSAPAKDERTPAAPNDDDAAPDKAATPDATNRDEVTETKVSEPPPDEEQPAASDGKEKDARPDATALAVLQVAAKTTKDHVQTALDGHRAGRRAATPGNDCVLILPNKGGSSAYTSITEAVEVFASTGYSATITGQLKANGGVAQHVAVAFRVPDGTEPVDALRNLLTPASGQVEEIKINELSEPLQSTV